MIIDKILEKISDIFGLSYDGFKKYSKNTLWLFIENIFRILVSFFVGIYVARYLGPGRYGLLSYSESFVGLFIAVATLGLDNVVVRELVHDKTKRDMLLGSAFILKIIGAIFLFIIVYFGVRFTDNDKITNLYMYIISFSVIFRSFDVIKFYFQSEVLSKYIVQSQIFSQIIISIIKLVLILINASLIYFVIVLLMNELILAIGFIFVYHRKGLSIFKWNFHLDVVKKILSDSWPLIFSGLAISLYMRIDQVMIKNLLDIEAVGNYAVAVRISEVWYFIPVVITNSIFPAIINAKKISEELYYERLQKLYDLMAILSLSLILPITIFSKYIILMLFGEIYNPAIRVLQIHIWASLFVFLGVASSKYLITENYTKIAFIRTSIGAIINIILNIILIPKYNIYGAAIATLFSQFFAVFSFIIIPKTYNNSILMIKSIFLVNFFNSLFAKNK